MISARQLGKKAYEEGKTLNENPFEVDTDDAYEWIDGWSEGEAEHCED